MKNLLIVIFSFFTLATFGQSEKIKKVGEEIFKTYETPHPYLGTKKVGEEVVWSEEVVHNGASYIAVHFSKVQLSKGDFIVVRSPDSTRHWKYKDLNVKQDEAGLWSIPVYGEKAIIEIYSKNKEGNYGYSIDKIAVGFSENLMRDPEAICGTDDSREVKCYQNTEPNVYNKSRAVARLLINGTGACTGWLIGSDGHLMTNNHCVGSVADANNITVEFMAEGANCNTNCQSWFACSGIIEATSTTLIQTDVSLDYSLLKLPNNVSNTYGYLQLRSTGPVLNERIYIPQHPAAWGKRVSVVSDFDQSGFATINSLSQARCTGGFGNDVGYFADTRGGSSGSPVLGYNDHLVVALHHCAFCPNRGVASNDIINHLGINLPTNAIFIPPPPTLCFNNRIFLTPISGFLDQEVNNLIVGTFNNIILPGANVTYDAGNQVRLKPGFKALQGSRFHAFIDGCGGNAKINGEANEMDAIENDIGLKIYPNPLSESANISYTLHEEDRVSIYLYDATGKTITTLAENQAQTVGKHQLELNASNLLTGIYYIKLQSNENHIIKKVMIAR